jgi:molecular chaperone DnaK
MRKAVGIDLGTTNSVAAVLELGAPTIVLNSEGGRLTPSVVAFSKNGDVLVGDVAKRQAVTNPGRTFRSIKRRMGQDWTTEEIDGRRYTPQEIAARVLMKVRNDAEEHTAQPITKAVVTVPAYFDESQRTATKEACQIAGLEVLRLINEPTAAALAYGLDRINDTETVLVFDLGGGTLDVSILEISAGRFEVKATAGDTRLGGDDWDDRVVGWILDRFQEQHGFGIGSDLTALTRVREAAEKAKIELSNSQRTQISLPFLSTKDGETFHLDVPFTREELETLTSDLLARCVSPFNQAVSDSGIRTSHLNHVLLIGGSTRMPAVRKLVRDLTGKAPAAGVNPDEAVAMGAAIQAGMLNRELEGIMLLDVTPLSLGIETRGGVCSRIIDRNTTIPTRRTKIFTTSEDGQTQVEIHVLQGERDVASGNKTLGKFHLKGLPAAPRRIPQVEVTFDIDASGIVTVAARDRATKTVRSLIITGQNALSPDEIQQMIRDAEANAETDRQIRENVEIRLAAESIVRRAEDTLVTRGGAFTPKEWDVVQSSVTSLRAALSSDDPDEIREAYEAFMLALRSYSVSLDGHARA